MSGLRYAEVSRKERKFLDLTSLTVEVFDQLVPSFEEAFQERMKEWRLDGKKRTGRAYTLYANSPLPTPEDRLLFILVYLKTNPLQVMQGEVFGLPQNKANQWIHTLLPVLQTTLQKLGETPALSMEELAERLKLHTVVDSPVEPEDLSQMVALSVEPQGEALMETESDDAQELRSNRPPFCHDGTERRIQRPKDEDEQKSHYSGKKKCHTVKNLVLVNKERSIVFLSPTYPGTVHDKRMADAAPYPLPEGSTLLQDLGFLSYKLDCVTIEMPTRKPRGGELTLSQKEANRACSHRRITIEHVNSSIKRCRILKDVCLLLLPGCRDQAMEICCALHNFRLRLDPWLPIPESE